MVQRGIQDEEIGSRVNSERKDRFLSGFKTKKSVLKRIQEKKIGSRRKGSVQGFLAHPRRSRTKDTLRTQPPTREWAGLLPSPPKGRLGGDPPRKCLGRAGGTQKDDSTLISSFPYRDSLSVEADKPFGRGWGVPRPRWR